MPICKKCNAKFPRSISVDGKERQLSRRKYCLECSPFMGHNTKDLCATTDIASPPLECSTCGKSYRYQRQRSSHSRCASCIVNSRRIARKQRAVDYKGGGCHLCGYNKCLRALSFHHKDPSLKSFPVSGNHCRSWDRVRRELDKCVLLCIRCHCEVHDGIAEQNW